MSNKMPRQYLPFIDWLKALGLALIVYGHVAPAIGARVVAPIYQKQLGVAFFVFVTGFTLAREYRTGWRVVYDRLFDLCAIGFTFAVMMSAVGMWLWQDPNESNYLPFAAGLNVLVNDFPANPTTWYIGTYIHLLVIWALVLRKVRVTALLVLATAVAECLMRAVLVEMAGTFIAYMFIGNWITVLTLGMWFGGPSRSGAPGAARLPWWTAELRRWVPIAAAMALIVGWPLLMRLVSWQLTFPLMSLPGDHWSSVLAASAATSFVYASYTLAAYALARAMPSHAAAQFFARSTAIVVIVHMPVYYLLEWILNPRLAYGPRVSLEFLICFAGLALLANRLLPYLDLKRRREQVAGLIERMLTGSGLRALGSLTIPDP